MLAKQKGQTRIRRVAAASPLAQEAVPQALVWDRVGGPLAPVFQQGGDRGVAVGGQTLEVTNGPGFHGQGQLLFHYTYFVLTTRGCQGCDERQPGRWEAIGCRLIGRGLAFSSLVMEGVTGSI